MTSYARTNSLLRQEGDFAVVSKRINVADSRNADEEKGYDSALRKSCHRLADFALFGPTRLAILVPMRRGITVRVSQLPPLLRPFTQHEKSYSGKRSSAPSPDRQPSPTASGLFSSEATPLLTMSAR
jgi:hypothetical protein